jgi:hypothetical protein
LCCDFLDFGSTADRRIVFIELAGPKVQPLLATLQSSMIVRPVRHCRSNIRAAASIHGRMLVGWSNLTIARICAASVSAAAHYNRAD